MAQSSSSYPSTPHLPFSPAVGEDDVVSAPHALPVFGGEEFVILEKLDGGNCCVFGGKVFARTHAAEASHASFSPVKAIAPMLAACLPPQVQLFGENMTAVHSMEYAGLKSPLYVFAARDAERGEWLAWDEVVALAEASGLPHAPVLFRGAMGSLGELRAWMEGAIGAPSALGAAQPEGFVARRVSGFRDAEFERSVAKYVRRGFVQTDASWRRTWRKAKIAR